MTVPSKIENSISILVVDDEDGIRNLLVDTLRALGYATLDSASTAGAIEILKKQHVDLVMSDYYMPGESGVVLLQKIKRQWPDIPVIMISGYVDEATKHELLASGADDFLAKPFRIKHVEETIGSLLLKYDKGKTQKITNRCTILVVDDDPDMRQYLRDALENLGYNHIEVGDGISAIECIGKNKVDALITDFMLADTSGKNLFKTIKSKRPDLPVIIITGYPLAYSKEMAEADGINGYLAKPFRVAQLKETLEKVLRNK